MNFLWHDPTHPVPPIFLNGSHPLTLAYCFAQMILIFLTRVKTYTSDIGDKVFGEYCIVQGMTRISSYAIHQCTDCMREHILPNYASISLTPAIDAFVPDEDLRICFGCGVVKPFKQFVYVGTKQKPKPDHTPSFVKLIKRLFGIRHRQVESHPTKVYPYLNQISPLTRSNL